MINRKIISCARGSLFRSCINCGSFFIEDGLLCQECGDLLINLYALRNPQKLSDFKVLPLFTWPPGKSDTLSKLILELKTAKLENWIHYSKKFSTVWLNEIIQTDSVLISHKSNSGNKHAFYWGEALSRTLRIVHLEGLKLQDHRESQKNLVAKDRAARSMERLVDISQFRNKKIFFVDDVVTTGSTALAAYKALGRPKNYQVLALAYRPISSIAAV